VSTLDRFKSLKVLVGVPSQNTMHARSALCLQAMMIYCMVQKVGDYRTQEVRLCNVRGSILANQRVDIVREALERKYSHLLFADSDQTYPKDMLHKLVLRDVDVVAANVAVKKIPSQPTARRVPLEGEPNSGMPVFTDSESHGLEKVWRVGTGVMLLKMKVFQKIGVNVFGQPWREDWQKYQGEDWSMCEAIEAAGFDIWIDHDLSNQVGHLGEFEFTHEVVGNIIQEQIKEAAHG